MMSLHKSVASIVLIIVYVYFFGQTSFRKYMDNAVIVTEDTEEPSFSIPQPVFTIFPPQNPNYGSNRKLGNGHGSLCSNLTGRQYIDHCFLADFNYLCSNFTGQHFIDCVENVSYSLSDVLPYINISYSISDILPLPYKFNLTQFFVSYGWGIVKSLWIPKGGFINDDTKAPHVELNESLEYKIMITDSKLQLYTSSPGVVPRSLFTFKEKRGKYFFFIQVIRHEKLNQLQKPCEHSPEYNFPRCVEKTIIARAGCQPHWRRFTVPGMPECDNSSKLTRYSEEYWKVGNLYREDLFRDTGCYLPCSYLEYKVSKNTLIPSILVLDMCFSRSQRIE